MKYRWFLAAFSILLFQSTPTLAFDVPDPGPGVCVYGCGGDMSGIAAGIAGAALGAALSGALEESKEGSSPTHQRAVQLNNDGVKYYNASNKSNDDGLTYLKSGICKSSIPYFQRAIQLDKIAYKFYIMSLKMERNESVQENMTKLQKGSPIVHGNLLRAQACARYGLAHWAEHVPRVVALGGAPSEYGQRQVPPPTVPEAESDKADQLSNRYLSLRRLFDMANIEINKLPRPERVPIRDAVRRHWWDWIPSDYARTKAKIDMETVGDTNGLLNAVRTDLRERGELGPNTERALEAFNTNLKQRILRELKAHLFSRAEND